MEHVRSMLLAEAERVKAPRAVRQRFGHVSCQPGFAHDDHMHLRFFCSAQDIRRGCQDASPLYPWRKRALRKFGVKPTLARYSRSQRRDASKRTVPEAEARAAMGRMHPSVRAFLDWRESWIQKPHPGRVWCR